jgi:SAM-dependent methyltransferase
VNEPDFAEEEGFDEPEAVSVEDEKFDQIYSQKIRRLSSLHWTPVRIAAAAAELLVTKPGLRVLDLGCGPGKFCLVAASLTDGHFTGVEQREDLVRAAVEAAEQLKLDNVEFVHRNVVDVAFGDYDAFYVFNPFEENMFQGYKIDTAVPLSPALFKKYTTHVANQLGERPLGTPVVTYMGYADEIPGCYTCERTLFGDDLKLWVKTREYDPELESLRLGTSRSYRGSGGWEPPKEVQRNIGS